MPTSATPSARQSVLCPFAAASANPPPLPARTRLWSLEAQHWQANATAQRAHVDDAATTVAAHARQNGLDHADDIKQIRVYLFDERGKRCLLQRAIQVRACFGYQRIELSSLARTSWSMQFAAASSFWMSRAILSTPSGQPGVIWPELAAGAEQQDVKAA